MLGSICSQFHWTVEYVLWGVNWPTVQMMLADMPWYDYKAKRGERNPTEEVTLNDLQDNDELKRFIEKVNKSNG